MIILDFNHDNEVASVSPKRNEALDNSETNHLNQTRAASQLTATANTIEMIEKAPKKDD